MTAQDMLIFDKYCKRCRLYCRLKCPWLCLSNDTCGGKFFRPDEEEKKEKYKKYDTEYIEELFNND